MNQLPKKGKGFSIKARIKSFVFAFAGIKSAMQVEHNMWIHLFVMSLVLILGFVFEIKNIDWAILIVCIAMVLAAEIMNSAVEKLVDLISPEYDPRAGKVKDMAAGAVLISALGAAIAGLCIFIPYLKEFT